MKVTFSRDRSGRGFLKFAPEVEIETIEFGKFAQGVQKNGMEIATNQENGKNYIVFIEKPAKPKTEEPDKDKKE